MKGEKKKERKSGCIVPLIAITMKRKPGLKCPKLEATVIKAEAHRDGSAVHAGQVSWPKLKLRLKKEKKRKKKV